MATKSGTCSTTQTTDRSRRSSAHKPHSSPSARFPQRMQRRTVRAASSNAPTRAGSCSGFSTNKCNAIRSDERKPSPGSCLRCFWSFSNAGVIALRLRLGNRKPKSHEAGHLKRRGDLLHLGVVVFLRLLRGILHRTEHRFGDDLGVLLQKFRVEGKGEKFARAIDFEFNRAASARDFDFLRFELGLERLDTALHFLRLLEKFTYTGHG